MELLGNKQYKANLHCHSTLSDGKLSPEELKKIYKAKGYSVLAITDHEATHNHSKLTDDKFLMITGYEAYIRPSKICKFDHYKPEIHLNLIAKNPNNVAIVEYNPIYCKYLDPVTALNRPKHGVGPRKFTVDYIQKFIDMANDAGYLVSLNHPCWSMQKTSDVLKLRNYYSMEIFNYSSMVGSGYAENMPIYDAVLREGFFPFCHGSDDNHNKRALTDPMCDSFGAWTMINSSSLDYKSVIKALEKGKFYASTGPQIKSLIREKNTFTMETSPVKRITMHMTPKYSKIVYDKKGGDITKTTFEIPSDAPYVYFSAIDEYGKKAYTHAYMVNVKK